MADLTGMLQAAAGAAGEENLYIEDVFSTYLYTGNGSTQTITNGIDLNGEGGLVWIKNRDQADSHILTDTERGATDILSSDSSAIEATDADTLTAFNSDGFALGADVKVNTSTEKYVSWAFRKAPKFFDIVTYTGTGVARTVAHNLGSVPGCIIVKGTSGSNSNWMVYHRANTAAPETDYLILNGTDATTDLDSVWNDTAPTDTVFTVGDQNFVNASGVNYVAYLFAHDAGGFGDDGLQNVVSCGGYTGNGNADGPTVTLGYEPQWLMIKRTSTSGEGWAMYDVMRGMCVAPADTRILLANSSAAEGGSTRVSPTATGFKIIDNSGEVNTNGGTYIYIAIRRGPMKTPEAGTEVYNAGTVQNNTGRTISPELGYPVDLVWNKGAGVAGWNQLSRLTGGSKLASDSTNAASTLSVSPFDNNTTVKGDGWAALSSYGWMFRRAPGFMDVVAYTGTGANRTVAHNLGVVPELMIVKNRSQADAWAVYAGDNTDYLVLNTTAATADLNTYWNDTSPTSTNFTVGTVHNTNASAENYIAYLFASLAGVSDIGTYTGNGSSVTVTTGFQPRFILVKRTDSTGNWIVGDSARGLVAGDDPYLLLNSTAAEDTDEDWVDVSATGFTVNETAANANVNTGTYLYLAIS